MPDTPRTAAQLAAAFLAASGRGDAPADLGERLLAVVASARAEHDEVPLDDDRFVRHLARHRPEGAPLDAWLGEVSAGDLYLACACAEGTPSAIQALDRLFRPQVGAFLSTFRRGPDFVEDVAQAVRERLLVSVDGTPPRIAEYSGRGPLVSWLRVVTMRLAISMRRKLTEQLHGDDEDAAQADPAPVDPVLDLLKRRHADAFNAALRAAVAALTSEQRDLLRRHFVEGATLEQVAAAAGVSRATAARRIAAARQEILAVARRQLVQKLSLEPAELSSLMGLMRSRFELSLSSAFPKR